MALPPKRFDGPGTFALQVREFMDKYEQTLGKTFENVLEYFSESLVRRSPVLTGNFRYNWQFTLNQPPDAPLPYPGYTLPGNQPGGENDFIVDASVTINRLAQQREAFQPGDKAFIYNLTYYSIPLEYGFSKKAPYGMVRVTAGEFATVVRNAVSQAQSEV